MIRSSGEIEKKGQNEAMPLEKKNQVDDQVNFVASPFEELGKGKRKEPLELEGVPPTIRGLEDFIIPTEESAPTPATASSTHLPPEGISRTPEGVNPSVREINVDNMGEQLLEVERKRREQLEYAELTEYLQKVLPENMDMEFKVLEYEIYFKNHYFQSKFRGVLRQKMPLLDETSQNLVDISEEEMKLRHILALILTRQSKEYNLQNLWQLEKDLSKPEMRDSLMDPVLSEYSSYFPKKRRQLKVNYDANPDPRFYFD
jgi:hypothetical protein